MTGAPGAGGAAGGAAAGLPVVLHLAGRRVVLTGGGGAALREATGLVGTGALVEVVAAEVVPALQDLADRGLLRWSPRTPALQDLRGAWLVLTCAEDADADARVARWADELGIWCVSDGTGSAGRLPAGNAAAEGATAAVRTAPGSGRVVLVGGGPGDPGLLTVRGLRALRDADVVVTDRLAPLAVLDDLDPRVEVLDVSKVPGGRSTPQERINELLVEGARAGKVVVRLKGGDGFVLGRGMEEAIACAEAGVAVEVVPGVTSATAVPALAGIPVTHKDLSQGMTVVSAHVPPGDPRSTLDWAALANGGTTLVLLMAVHTLPAVTAALRTAGMPASTPVACVEDGGLPSQRVLTGTLADIAEVAADRGLRAPAITVVGQVARFASTGPLRGRGPRVGA